MDRQRGRLAPPRSSAPGGRRWRLLQLLVLFATTLACARAVFIEASGGVLTGPSAGPPLMALGLVGTAGAYRAARLRDQPARTRRAWRILTVGYLLINASNAVLALDHTFPGPGNVLRLAVAPVLLLGLLCLTSAKRPTAERLRLGLDVGVVAAGGFMIVWYFALGRLVDLHDVQLPALATAVAYPVADMVVLFGAAAALLRGAPQATRRLLAVLVAGLVLFVVADLYYASTTLAVAIESGNAPLDTPFQQWIILYWAFGLLACAALEPSVGAPAAASADAAASRPPAVAVLLPYLAILGGYGLLVVIAAGTGLYPWGGLVIGAVLMTALVVARQLVVAHENHHLVVTDHLTGLSSRVALNDALDRALRRTRRGHGRVGVLLMDMNGFKAVNDELGHDVGDELLVRFAGLLRGSVEGTDAVGRLGGDEFVAVLPGLHELDDAVRVALRLLDSMRTPLDLSGHRLTARASIGVALSRDGDTGRDLLKRADTAMYRAKKSGSGWALEDDAPAGDAPAGDVPGGGVPAESGSAVEQDVLQSSQDV